MTQQEFLQKLSKTPRVWRLDNGRHIRCGENVCPIVSLTAFDHSSQWCEAGVSLGMEYGLAMDVALVADNAQESLPSSLRPLRAELLAACGLGPKPHATIRTPDQFVRDLQAEFSPARLTAQVAR